MGTTDDGRYIDEEEYPRYIERPQHARDHPDEYHSDACIARMYEQAGIPLSASVGLAKVEKTAKRVRFTSDTPVDIKDITDFQGLQGVVNRIDRTLQDTNDPITEYDMWLIGYYALRFYRKNLGHEFVDDSI